jgi:hypothetical protein
MPQRSRVRGSLMALALLGGVLSSMLLWATEPATPVCQAQDLMTTHPLRPHIGTVAGRGVRMGQHLQRMYCAAQRIMAEPMLQRRLPYEDMRQDVARASMDLLTQLQQLATADTRPAIMAFARAFHAFRDLNAALASDALLAETPADMEAVRALAAEKGDAAYAQAHAALQTLVARLGPTASPDAVRAAVAAPDYWPTAGWRLATPAQQGMDTARLADMLERIQQQAHAIDSVTIVRHGYLVLDA